MFCYVGEKTRAVINFILLHLISCFEYCQMLSVFLVYFIVKTQSTRLKGLSYLFRERCSSTSVHCCVDVNGLALKEFHARVN